MKRMAPEMRQNSSSAVPCSPVPLFFRKFLVTGLGTGYLPLAPGTWGSAAVVGTYLLLVWVFGGRGVFVNAVLAAICLAACVVCVTLGRFAEVAFGREDPRQCTIDEWAGQALALLLLPLPALWSQRLLVAGVALVAFRLFDTIKPPPLRRLEKLPHGWGVLLDDLAAGLYANLCAQVLLRYLW